MRKKTIVLMFLCVLFCFTSSGAAYATVSGSDSTGWRTNAATDDLVLNGNNIHTTGSTYPVGAGLYAQNSSSMTLNNGSIITDGWQASAIVSTSGSTVTMSSGSVTALGYMALGVWVTQASHVNLSDVDVSTEGESGYGIYVSGGSYADPTTLSMTGGSVETLYAATTPAGDVGPVGVYVHAHAEAELTNVSIVTHAGGAALNNGAYGVFLRGDNSTYTSKLKMTGGSILVHGDNSAGIMSNGKASASVDTVTIETTGSSAFGVYAYGTGANVKSSFNITDSNIITSGNSSSGVYLAGNGDISISGGSIETGGNSSHGAYVTGTNNTAGSASVISLDNVSAATTGNASHGVYSVAGNNNSSYAYLRGITAATSGSNSHAIYSNRGNIQMKGASLTADDSLNSYAIYANGTSAAPGLVIGEESIYDINGAIVAGDYGSIDITMGGGSALTGRTSVAATNSTLDMVINGANSLWDVTRDSTLTALTLDGSTVNFNYTNVMGTTITAVTLNSGAGLTGGNFIMKADIVSETADNLIISGSTDGAHYITVLADATAATTGSEVTTLVETADQNGSFTLSTGTVDSGAWTYSLRQAQNVSNSVNTAGTGANWELYASSLSNPGSGGVNTFYAAYLLGYAETNTLIQRLGDLRQTPNENGLWFRGHGGRFKSNAKSYVKPFEMDYWGIQLGYDRKLNIRWDGDAYFGVMFGYSKGDLDYLFTGSGEVNSKMAGIYGTFIQPSGFYLDAILKYQWMDNEFSTLDSGNTIVTGSDVSTGGFGFSIEVGQRIPFGRKNAKGWYAEPQVQFTYQRYGDGYFTASNGLHIGLNGFTSMIGRLGVLIGYETENSNLYGKLFRTHEFDGDVVIMANGQPVAEDFGGSWWVYGLGYTARMNEHNSIYVEIERTSGGSFKQDWAVKGGWRMVF